MRIVTAQLPLLICLLSSNNIICFANLGQAQQYAATVPEFPESDTDDLKKPDYSTFYRSLRPSWFKRALTAIGLKTAPLLQTTGIETLIDTINTRYKETPIARHTEITVPAGTQITVFGSLYGAFHSLVRGLTELKRQGIINGTFTLQKPHRYFVFMGNTISFSAYSLETLTLILKLMVANKERVFFLAGHQELKKHWHHYNLKQELEQRAPSKEKQLTNKINTLFAQLPQRLWVTLQESKERILFSVKEPKKITYSTLITDDTNVQNYKEGYGLYPNVQPDIPTIWQLVSSPVKLYRVQHGFFYDAFANIVLNKTLDTSTIMLYYSTGAKISSPFIHGGKYNLKTGTLLVRGIQFPATTTVSTMPLPLTTLSDSIGAVRDQVAKLTKQVRLIHDQLPNAPIQRIPTTTTKLLTKLDTGIPLSPNELQEAAFEVEQLYNALVLDVEHLVTEAQKKEFNTAVSDPEKKVTDTIVLGSSLDVTKSAKGLGIPFRSGMSLKVNKQNQEGGIHGKRVQIIFLDDGYIPAVSRQNIQKLRTVYHTPFILAPVGSPTLLASMDLIPDIS